LIDKEQDKKSINENRKSNPLISVISINYNSAFEDVQLTINSVLNQSYQNLEYIIIDGASTNGSLDIIKSFQNKIDVLVSEKDSGIYEAMNKGIRLAKGDWIILMNMGDAFIDDQLLLNRIVNSGKLEKEGIVYGNTIMVKGQVKYIKHYHPNLNYNIVFGVLKLNHQSILTHRSVFNKIGLFDEKRFRIGADFYWMNKVLYEMGNSAFSYIDEIIAIYKEEGVSSNQNSYKRMHFENRILLKDFSSKFMLYLNEIIYFISLIKTFFYNKLIAHPNVYLLYRKLKYFNSKKVSNLN
jgi:glycosyltransferase involved in cell wall biosynthesis